MSSDLIPAYLTERNEQVKETSFYPLPSSDEYEKFLKKIKKDQYNQTQYSLTYLLSLKQNYINLPKDFIELKIPLKNEIKSRARVLTDEAFRDTRNYIDVYNDIKNEKSRDFFNNFNRVLNEKSKKIKKGDEEIRITYEIRELLNKITEENFDLISEQILKIDYDEEMLEKFKTLVFAKAVTEKFYREIYVKLCFKMFKLYNKKMYPSNPKMNLKSLLLKRCQEEFYNSEKTTITFPFQMDGEEESARLREIKLGNIRLIGDFFIKNAIPIKIIQECVEFLFKNVDNSNMSTFCELLKKICKKLYFNDPDFLNKMVKQLEEIYKKNKNMSSKTKFLMLDILELRDKNWKITEEDKIKINKEKYEKNEKAEKLDKEDREDKLGYDFSNSNISKNRKTSEFNSRKSSINPSNVEYIKRSRFNSRADELTHSKEENNNLMEELIGNLGSDIEFYQCFKLTEEEFDKIKVLNNSILKLTDFEVNEIKENFQRTLEEIYCEKFIAVGHLLENLFSQNVSNSNTTMNYLIFLYRNEIIDNEDIKHGIVLGLVNFIDNIIDYPNTKEYLRKFLEMVKHNNIMDEKLLKVYQRCCENIEKCLAKN